MATHATASAVIHLPVDQVWKALRQFDFPGKLISTVKHCTLVEGASTQVGAIPFKFISFVSHDLLEFADVVIMNLTWVCPAVRKIEWEGQWKKQRLIELSDLHFTATWELIESEPHAESMAVISTLKLFRITEDNSTLVSWSSEFSSDVPRDLVAFEQKSYQENLTEIRKALTHHK